MQLVNTKGWMFIGNSGASNDAPIYIRTHNSYNQITLFSTSHSSRPGEVALCAGATGTERLTTASYGIYVNGNVKVPSGNGIDFSASPDIATGETTESQILDDYEVGSFTPTLSSGTSTTPTSSGYGGYVKVGRIVHFQFYLIITAATGSAGHLKFGGLPFTSSSSTFSYGGATLTYQIAMFDKAEDISFFVGASDDELKCYTHDGNNLPGNSSLMSDLTSHVSFVGSYIAAG